MRKIIDIAINDLIVFFKDPGAIIGVLVIPIIFSIVFGFAFSGSNEPTRLRVDVIDNDQSALSGQFLTDLRAANSALVLCPFDNTEDDFCRLEDDPLLTEERSVARLTNNTALALIVIPVGFEANLAANEPVSITYRSNENAAAPSYILQSVQAVVQRMGGAQVAASVGLSIADQSGVVEFADEAAKDAFRQNAYDNAAEMWTINPFAVEFNQTVQDPSTQVSGSQQGFGQSVPGMATMFVTFFVLLSAVNIIRERKNWTIQRLVTMPLTRAQILSGKILMYFLLGMIQFSAMFGFGVLVTTLLSLINPNITTLNLGNDFLALVLIMVSFTLCTTALGFAIGTFIKSEMQGAAMLNLLGLTLAPLGGAWWPLDIVPEFMRVIGHFSPIAWAMDGFRVLLYERGTLVDVLLPVTVLLALALVFFAIAIRRFKFE
jgi:ABC-2 type transport system permease protein